MKQVASRGVLALLALALVAGTASAQVQTGEIFGKVTDATGGVLPGVTVTIESPALITPQTAVTAESGAYRFPNVPIAIYTVRFEITGFSRLVRSDVTIQAGFNAEINAKLEVSTVQETVTVSGESPIVDTKSTTIGTNFNKDMLEKIPSARDPWVILEQTPGMVMDRQNVGGNQSGQQSSFLAHGSSSNQIWNIDGATITDMAAGGSPTYYDFDSFEEIQIQTGGADASTEAGGVSINFVTKSGGNSFKGSDGSTSPISASSRTTSTTNSAPRAPDRAIRFRTSRSTASRWAARSSAARRGSGARTESTTSRSGSSAF
jgi:hypothetical protein